ncbi:MAG: hypothetical protein ACMUIP_10320 [bacterium]
MMKAEVSLHKNAGTEILAKAESTCCKAHVHACFPGPYAPFFYKQSEPAQWAEKTG